MERTPSKYHVFLMPQAEEAYRRLTEAAAAPLSKGKTSHSAVKLLRLVDECLDTLIPHAPTDPRRALAGNLSNVFRVKKGRIRILYVVSSSQLRIAVLYISETPRKEGDKNDPYVRFGALLDGGEFDKIFEQLGLRQPSQKRRGPKSIQ